MKKQLVIDLSSCLECPFHRVIGDPDPDDWFNDDDKAIVCTKKSNQKLNINSRYASDRQMYAVVESSMRPTELKKENVEIPKWCPI